MSDTGEGFLGRWSRRKRATAEPPGDAPGGELPPEPAPQDPPAPPETGLDAEAPPISEAELAALPRIEEIGPGTDIRPFLRRGVPESLRNAALRRLWTADPAIRDYVDVALDYAFDFNTPGGVPGGGGTISPARVAEMLHRLTAPAAPAERKEETAVGARAETSAGARDEDDGATRPASAEAVPSSAPPAPERTVAGGRPGSGPDTDAPSRRRHGGATPT